MTTPCAWWSRRGSGGLVLNGQLHPGPTGNAGHIGHISVDLNGYLLPVRFARLCGAHRERSEHRAAAGWRRRPGPDGDTSAAAVAAAAREGDPVAVVASFERAAKALAAGIAATATLVGDHIAVIGGRGPGTCSSAAAKALADDATLSFVRRLTVAPALMGTDAGLVGAAAAALSSSQTTAERVAGSAPPRAAA